MIQSLLKRTREQDDSASNKTKRAALLSIAPRNGGAADDDSIPDSDGEGDEALPVPVSASSDRSAATTTTVEREVESEQELLSRLEQRFPPLTAEQRAIVLHQPAAGAHIVVNACAGTGKTTAARLIAERFRHLRILYVVFNKAAQEEAAQKMPPNVDCRTTHSLALQFAKSRFPRNGVTIDKRRNEPWSVVRTLENFCADGTRSRIDAEAHCPPMLRASRISVAAKAQFAWDVLIGERTEETSGGCGGDGGGAGGGSRGWTFDALLKYMSLERDASQRFLQNRFDMIVVDEAQDTQSVLMPWYASIRSLPVYLIGDTYQSIYGFCGARDAMEEALALPSSVRFNLTHSFRFGTFVGDLASRLLIATGLLEPRLRITGDEQRATRIEIGTPSLASLDEVGSVMFIARTNATIIGKAFEASAAKKSVRLIGRTRETLRKVHDLLLAYNNVSDATAKSQIRKRLNALVRQAAARARKDYQPADLAADDDDEAYNNDDTSLLNDDELDEYQTLQLIKKYGVSMTKGLLRNIEQTADSSSADVSLCTVHASKGLEFGCVALLDDFFPLHLLRHALLHRYKDDSIHSAE